MLSWLASFISGPIVNGIINGYKAKLAAGNNSERIAADLAQRELEVQQTEIIAQNQLKVAEIGRWYEPDHLFAYTLWVYFTKVYIWDAAFHMGSTDAVKGDASGWAALVVSFYFGKRGLENITRILKR